MTGARPPALSLKLAVLCVSVLIGVAAFEAICRSLDIDFNPNPTRRFHASLGWTQERSMDYEFDMEGNRVRVQFNALGFRDVEHAVDKPPGTKRVVVIGDSFSEAIQVNLEETYWKQLEYLLNTAGNDTWEVINLGVGDYGNAQAFRALVEYGLQSAPDVVLFQIFPLNDICNNSIDLAGMCHSTSDLDRPYFVEEQDGLRMTWVQPLRHWLRANMVSYGVVERAVLTMRGDESAEDGEARNRERYLTAGFPSDPIFYAFAPPESQPDAVVKGWRITESVMRMVDELCRERGIRWLPVVMPVEVFVGTPWEKFSSSVTHLGVTRDYADKRIAEAAKALGAPSVSLLEVFDAHQDTVLPYRGGHLNPAGHALAASTIHDALLRSKVVPALPLHINFGTSGARRWLRHGWFSDEAAGGDTFVWSDGGRSILEVPLPADHDVAMTFDCVALQFPDSPAQKVTVLLNGSPIREITLKAARDRYTVVLPKAALKELFNTLELHYAFTKRPVDVIANSQDTRPLAVAWYALEFTEARLEGQ